MTPEDVDAMRSWHYPDPYGNYDLDADPDDTALMLSEIAAGGRWYAAVDAGRGELVGFFEFVVEEGDVEIGLGLRPDLIGSGRGASFVEAGLSFAQDAWSPRTFSLDVFPWNERAITVYERGGFVRGEVYTRRFEGGAERVFLRMSRPA
jgi:ribosomal-protein-alanine N-acetyltransferase